MTDPEAKVWVIDIEKKPSQNIHRFYPRLLLRKEDAKKLLHELQENGGDGQIVRYKP